MGLTLFILVNVWTISIHDAHYAVPSALKHIVNGSAHHTDHHLYYSYNYGQYFTLWDYVGGSYRNPSPYEGKGPYDHDVIQQIKCEKDRKMKKQTRAKCAMQFIPTLELHDYT